MKRFAFLFFMSFLSILASRHASADSTVERVTLRLTGSGCGLSFHQLEDSLRKLAGVLALDGHSIPDHVLIDIDKGSASADDLAHLVSGWHDPSRIVPSQRHGIVRHSRLRFGRYPEQVRAVGPT